jgi:hypothetical protein
MAENEEKPKIIVDDDWKAQARAEKEKLSKQTEAAPEQGAAGAPGELPPANFAGLVSSLVSNVVYSLGGYEDPHTHKRYVDLQVAKHYIDLLAVVEEKTRGNLSEDEKKLLDAALYEIRMQYVQIAQRLSQV